MRRLWCDLPEFDQGVAYERAINLQRIDLHAANASAEGKALLKVLSDEIESAADCQLSKVGNIGWRSSYDPIEKRVDEIAKEWRKVIADEEITSRTRFYFRAYEQIIELGKHFDHVTSYLLVRMMNGEVEWHNALSRINECSPVPQGNESDKDEVIKAWGEWAHETGHFASLDELKRELEQRRAEASS